MAQMNVTAVVLPKVVIEVMSPVLVNVGVVLNPGATAAVWLDGDVCSAPKSVRTIDHTGISPQMFEENEAAANSTVCVRSSDDVLRASAKLR